MNWIKENLQSSTISMLVNGSPTTKFIPSKCLRQGDPLIPVFISNCCWRASWNGKDDSKETTTGRVRVGDKKVLVHMLQFADGTLFLCEAKTKKSYCCKEYPKVLWACFWT